IHKVFSNVEQMTFHKTQSDSSLFLLNNLPKLSTLTIHFYQSEILRDMKHVMLMAFGFWVSRDDINT
ncbi:unnamed protein product, partial [Rotaria sp. Silwood1]